MEFGGDTKASCVPFVKTLLRLLYCKSSFCVCARYLPSGPCPKLGAMEKVRKDVCGGVYLSSRRAAPQVFSARVSLTSVFGMGTGGTSPSLTPTV